jgi:hypothetical protein
MVDGSLAAHNRGDRDDMVRIGRVAHAEKKAKNTDGKQGDHFPKLRRRCYAVASFNIFEVFLQF